jgi:hypothetical protein
MRRLSVIGAVACASVILSACGEVDQAKTADRHVPDAQPWQGAKNAYVAPGWKPGDKNAWETQIRTRQQNQNDYVKVN